MRDHPIGTGPFKFVEFEPNQSITLARDPGYWKPGRLYSTALCRKSSGHSTRLLSFIAGRADVYFGVTFPQLQDVKRQVPGAVCDNFVVNGSRNLIVNRDAPPFDDPDLRRAMSLTLDPQASSTSWAKAGRDGRSECEPARWVVGHSGRELKTLPGYGPDVFCGAPKRADHREPVMTPASGSRSLSRRAMFRPGATRRLS